MAIKIDLYDTTLRDGAQSEDVNLSAADKVRIARQLDFLGVDYIEGGWPAANPVETEFFQLMRDVELKNARLVAFGSTHHAGHSPENDPTMQALVSCGVRVATIFGKTCPRHVEVALGITKERNLEIVGNSVAYLKEHLDTVFFDAEHFFDGYHRDAEYAIKVLTAAYENGADCLILCDTNGGTMPDEISRVVAQVKEQLPEARIGIHAHNDCELAVANSLAAVKAGATHVQGTMNGIGERCGNANLCSVIPNLQLKMEGYECLSAAALTRLKSTSAFVSEVSNLAPFRRQPFVGNAAFAHKGGVHVSAIMKDSALYEHMSPASVGNAQRVLMTEQGGKSNIMALARSLGIELDKGDPILELLSGAVKKNSALGYDYVAAPASAELLFLRHRHSSIKPYFKILRSVVLTSRHEMDPDMMVEATLKLKVNGQDVHTAAGGHGPVHALDRALRRALTQWYPELEQMHLIDYKVRVLSPTRTNIPDAEVDENGAGSNVRVLIESSDGVSTWTTVGVSYNIIEASLEALCDAISYKLYKAEHSRWRAEC